MDNSIKIGDFLRLTGCTLKTIRYYHQIGLLAEPQRTPGGYRLYGPAELTRMLVIKRLKSLGLDLQRIKEILGEADDPRTLRELLRFLQIELSKEKESLEEQIVQIEKLLQEDELHLDENNFGLPSYQVIAEILGPEHLESYKQTTPALFEQHQKVHGYLDNFHWGEDYQETFRSLAEYFQAHPEQYQMAMEARSRLARLDELSADDPEVEALARESVELIQRMPLLAGILRSQPGLKEPLKGLYNEVVAGVLSPARMKHKQLIEEFLAQQSGKGGPCHEK